MLIPQIIVVEEVLPEVRRRLSRSLTSNGWSQESIAELLGISQAMVSKYQRDRKTPPMSLEKVTASISRDLEVAAVASASSEELISRFLSGIEKSMAEGDLTERYRERFEREPPRSCYGGLNSERTRSGILRDLEMAAFFLMENPIKELVPAVKINMACAMDGAEDHSHVAAFPGRIPDSNGRILRPLPPEFGTSMHLAKKLLDAMEKIPRIRASINLKVSEDIRAAIENMEWAKRLEDGEQEDLIHYSIDPGDFGIEPCLYLFSSSPLSLAKFTVDLNEHLKKGDMR